MRGKGKSVVKGSIFLVVLCMLICVKGKVYAAEYHKVGFTFEREGRTYEVTKQYDGVNYGRCKLIKVSNFWHVGGKLVTTIGLNGTVGVRNGENYEYFFVDEFAEGLFKNNVELEEITIHISHSHTYEGIPLSAEKNVIPKNMFSGCKYLEDVTITSGYTDNFPKGAKKLTFEKNAFNKCSDTLFIRFIGIGAKNVKVKKGVLGKGSCKRPVIINTTDNQLKTLNSNKDRLEIAKMFKKSGAKRKIQYVYKSHNGLKVKTLK